jgi:hypothetical protein
VLDGAQSIAGIPFERLLALQHFADSSASAVYVSGSLVTPFANPWSDVDVYAISDRGPIGIPIAEPTDVVAQHFLENRRVDYEFWRPADVVALADRLGNLRLGVASHPVHGLFTYNEECFIHRLRVGVPMLGHERFEEFRQAFDFETFSRYQSQEAIRESDGFYEDVCGMLEANDLDAAVLNARTLMTLATDAYLHDRGNTDPNRKWRARYLQLFENGSPYDTQLRRDYWQLEFPGDVGPAADEDHRRRYVGACISFSRRVISTVQS